MARQIRFHYAVMVSVAMVTAGCEEVCQSDEYSEPVGIVASDGSLDGVFTKRGMYSAFYLVASGCPHPLESPDSILCFPAATEISVHDMNGTQLIRTVLKASNYALTFALSPKPAALLPWLPSSEQIQKFEETGLNPADQVLTNGSRYAVHVSAKPVQSGISLELRSRYVEKLPWFCVR